MVGLSCEKHRVESSQFPLLALSRHSRVCAFCVHQGQASGYDGQIRVHTDGVVAVAGTGGVSYREDSVPLVRVATPGLFHVRCLRSVLFSDRYRYQIPQGCIAVPS